MSDFSTWMSDFYNSDVGFLQLGCRILTTRMSDFNNSYVEFFTTARMSDFNNSDVEFFTTRMSDFNKSDVGFSKDFDVGFSTTRMAPTSFRRYHFQPSKVLIKPQISRANQ